MIVLDLDLDYFLDCPVCEQNHSSDARVTDESCVQSVWSEERVRAFLENNLGLSKDKKIKGRVFKGHDEALYFWNELIEKKELVAPFSVVHVDSHPDLGFGCVGRSFIYDELIYYPIECRTPRCCENYQVDGRFYNIDIGDYLLFGVAFRWFSKIIYCANPNCDCGAIPREIINREVDPDLPKASRFTIKLKPSDTAGVPSNKIPNEPSTPLYIVPTVEEVKCRGQFDFISIAQSPNYTPENADFILDIFREYVDEI